MKILISTDMEGISGVVDWTHVDSTHAEYNRFRRLMTADVNAAVRGALKGGADQVVVTDAHGAESIAIRPIGLLALAWDHRAFDGAYAAAFLDRLRDIIETRDWSAEVA